MNRRSMIILGVIAAVVILWVGWRGANNLYFAPKAELVSQIESARAAIDRASERVARMPALERQLTSYADRTLGSDKEEVDAHLRRRLNRIAEAVNVTGATVGTGGISTKLSPARRAFPRSGQWEKLREEIDFVELDGWISGEGTLAQVVQLVDRIEAEPWLKRINQLKLDPKDNGGRFSFSVRLSTIYLPGKSPADGESAEYDPGRLGTFASLMEKNPFRVPEAKPAPAPAPPAVEPQAPPIVPEFPYEQWVVTGVASSQAGEEVWLRNSATGETRILQAGQGIGKAVFTTLEGDSAVFRINNRHFMVQAGRNLNDRSPLNP